MMIQVSHLSKEERVETIFKNILQKDSMNLSYSPQYSVIDGVELMTIINSIEDRIYYIADSPAFEFKGHNYTNGTFRCNSIEDFRVVMDSHLDDFFVIYSIQLNPMVVTIPNIPNISHPKSYHLRGIFINDPSISRNKIINQILDEK